jgi:hypothetical protein
MDGDRMGHDLTVIYYTANRESEVFERKIQDRIVQNSGGIPIISVSQKPIEFGRNICVGDVGASGHNAFRQFYIGASEAKTQYIAPAEADFIYPKEYFEFRPPSDDRFWVAKPLYVLFSQRGYGKYFALKPRGSEAAMVVARDLLLKRMEQMFRGLDLWGPLEEEIWLLRRQPQDTFTLETPVITFKTDRNMHRKTPHDVDSRVKFLDPLGEAHDLIKEFGAHGR